MLLAPVIYFAELVYRPIGQSNTCRSISAQTIQEGCLFVLRLGVMVGCEAHLVSFCLTIVIVFAEIPYGLNSLRATAPW